MKRLVAMIVILGSFSVFGSDCTTVIYKDGAVFKTFEHNFIPKTDSDVIDPALSDEIVLYQITTSGGKLTNLAFVGAAEIDKKGSTTIATIWLDASTNLPFAIDEENSKSKTIKLTSEMIEATDFGAFQAKVNCK